PEKNKPEPSTKELRERVKALCAKKGPLTDEDHSELIEKAALLRDFLVKDLRAAVAKKLKLTVTELKLAMKARLKEIETAAAKVEAQSAVQSVTAQDPRDMLTDTWNGARFAREHHERVRYVIELGQWAVWDGRRWRISNDTTTVEALAKETVLGIGEL